MKTFRAPWGRTLKWVSVLVSVLLIAFLWSTTFGPHGRNTLFLELLWMLLPITALFTIRGYTVTPEAILVHRPFWHTRLPREGLLSATVEPKAMKGSLRTCGNGGLYSFTGWYWSKKLGRYRAFVTDLNRTVVLRWEKRTVVISPDDPEGFVREVMG
ncbi:MAG: PH domain-containing protein [Verrucomicrobiota bacterium]